MNAVVPENVLDRSDASCGRRERSAILKTSSKDLAEKDSSGKKFLHRKTPSAEERLQQKSAFSRRTSSEDNLYLRKSILRRRTSSRRKTSGEELLQRKRIIQREACAEERGEHRLLSLGLTSLGVQVLSPKRVQNSGIWRNRGVRKIIPI